MTPRTYINCPKCSRHLETRHMVSEMLMAYAMGSPQKSCRHCRWIYGTGSKEWIEFGKLERGLYLVLQTIQALLMGAGIGFAASLVMLCISVSLHFSENWAWLLGVIAGIVMAGLLLVVTKLEIESSGVRSRVYAVQTEEGQIVVASCSYHEIMSMVAGRHWPLSLQATADPQLASNWIDLQQLLSEGDDSHLCDFRSSRIK